MEVPVLSGTIMKRWASYLACILSPKDNTNHSAQQG